MDRIDLHLEVPPVHFKDLSAETEGPSSSEILDRVIQSREIQNRRFHKTIICINTSMNSRQIRQFCKIDEESNYLLEKAMEKLGLSARAHSRILKIARTIADLEDIPDIKSHHVAEAIQYRTLDRRIFR